MRNITEYKSKKFKGGIVKMKRVNSKDYFCNCESCINIRKLEKKGIIPESYKIDL